MIIDALIDFGLMMTGWFAILCGWIVAGDGFDSCEHEDDNPSIRFYVGYFLFLMIGVSLLAWGGMDCLK